MTSDNETEYQHWCNHSIVYDRVTGSHCSNEQPIADILDVQNRALLPLLDDHMVLMKNYTVLVSHVLIEHFTKFKDSFSDIVPQHIPYKYYNETKEKTDKINLGII